LSPQTGAEETISRNVTVSVTFCKTPSNRYSSSGVAAYREMETLVEDTDRPQYLPKCAPPRCNESALAWTQHLFRINCGRSKDRSGSKQPDDRLCILSHIVAAVKTLIRKLRHMLPLFNRHADPLLQQA
jgi:hypothetical protein